MADDVPITVGSGPTKVATDDLGSNRHAQIVKIGLGSDGQMEMLDKGPQSAANSLPVVGASSAHDVAVSGTRPNDATPYTTNQVVGQTANGLLTFANVGLSGGAILLTGASLEFDTGAIPSGMSGFRLALYNAAPTTPLANQVDFDLSSADRTKWLGIIDLGLPADLGSTLYCEVNNIGKQIRLATTDLWAYLITNGGWTPGEVSTGFKITLHTLDI